VWAPETLAPVIVECCARGLQRRRDELTAEQAVRGIDALSEREIHPLLRGALLAAGLGALSEVPYPGQPGKRPRHAERLKCDLVVTASPDAALIDPVAELKAIDAAAGTLFASSADAMARESRRGVPPDEAYWLEVKSVGQHCYTNGVPGPNRTYSSELLSVVPTDVPKLAADATIRHAGLLLVLFTETNEVAEHDVSVLMHKCLDRGLPVSWPATERFPIPDMIGNRRCTLSLVPVRTVAWSGGGE
jgi:hypothetical protein